ncbi:FG-GAP-like repeat-containing protein [Nonomuraea sp. NPDC049269]|uniref:FG-GAP-like repeat-containing protein n=1 Tax=Nonomuraea sp. NPDC049269 TaxID=3364349 RepID=UPI0037168F62
MRKGFVTLLTAVAAIATSVVVAQPALAAGPRPDFRAPWPCGQVRDYYHHSGEVANAIDFNIAGSGDLGTPALASAPGTVIDTVTGDPGYGNYVRVDHGGGWTSLVAHLDRITVSRGAWVNAGQELGKVGTTGNSTGPHLHYEQEADGVNQPVIVDGVAMNYDGQTRRHTSGNCGGGGGGSLMLGGSPADFNGDGKEDIVTFTHNASGDVYVALSTGSGFAGTSVKWHDYFSIGGETPLTGDFNGDGKDDIVTFTHGAAADVYVALSDGTKFGTSAKWHDWFAPTGEIPAVGDFNGDGKDDIATFTHNATADVYVALSTGTGFTGTSVKWHDFFAPAGEFPAVGDVNGDGKDDIIVFTQGSSGDVYWAQSTGNSFQTSAKVHDWFAPAGELPRVGDFNGDGKDDIATFTNSATADDAYVALSTGTGFGPGTKWNDHFVLPGEFPYTGDYNGDGKDDIVTFTLGKTNDVYVGISNTTSFGTGTKWHDFFGLPGEITL